jgi:hypothetical protein
MLRSCGLLLAAVAALAFVPLVPAQAQIGDLPYVDAVGAWASAQNLRRTLPGSANTSTGTKQPSKSGHAPRPTARQLATLRFRRNAGVTRSNYQAVIDALGPGHDPAQLASELDRLRALFHQAMREGLPWSPNDVGDVAAFTVLTCYALYHLPTESTERAREAVRRAVRLDLASDKRVRRLSDARKQTAAEMLELRTILLVSDFNKARIARDVAARTAAEAAIRSWIKDAFGVDLAAVKLTRNGLVSR